MSLYCRTNAGRTQVEEGPRTLPTVYAGIANFHLLSDAELLNYYWYPWVLVDAGAPGNYYTRSLTDFQIQATEVVQTANYVQWDIEEVRALKNSELRGQLQQYTTNEQAINPKVAEYVNNDAKWLADGQADLARLSVWEDVANFDTTKPVKLALPNSYVGASYVKQGVELTAQNQAAEASGLTAPWDQTVINSFVSANQTAADDVSNSQSPTEPTFEIRQGVAVPSEQYNRIVIYRIDRDDPIPALRRAFKMTMSNRQDARDLHVFQYTNSTYLAWSKFEDQGDGVWTLEAHPSVYQYTDTDLSFIFSYGTNPAVEADYFTDRIDFPAGVEQTNILVAWDLE